MFSVKKEFNAGPQENRSLGFPVVDAMAAQKLLNSDFMGMSPTSSLTESRCPAKGLPRERS